MTPRRDGVDVSKHQGKIDWQLAKDAGIVACAIRATTGTIITSRYRKIVDGHDGPIGGMYVDGQLAANRAGAKAAEVKYRFLYHLLNGTRPLEEQADHFLATVMPLAIGEGVLLDYEVAPWTVDQAREWCEYVEARTGRPVAFYGRGERWAAWRDTRLFNGTRPRWLSCWIPEAKARAAAAPYWGDAWQWTSKGTCPGVVGRVDLSQVDNPHGFDACCGIGEERMTVMQITPGLPPTWGPYGEVDGARYSTAEHLSAANAPYLVRLGIELHSVNGRNVGGTAAEFFRNHFVPKGDRTSSSGSLFGISYHEIVGSDASIVVALDERACPNSSGQVANIRMVHILMLHGDWTVMNAKHEAVLETLAQECAELCLGFGIPPTWCNVANEPDKAKRMAAALLLTNDNHTPVGIFGHQDVSAAYKTLLTSPDPKIRARAVRWKNNHGDPGTAFPEDRLIARVQQIIQGDTDMAQLVNTPGDPAAFEVSGTTARWIPDWAALVWLWDHNLVSKTLTTIPRADLRRLHLLGPVPFAGVSAIRGSEFATWTPAA